MIWRIRTAEFRFPRPALVLGIVNVTPDSFSDGGRFLRVADAIRHGQELVRQGADLLDIGGESTRPGAAPVSADVELARVLPVIQGLASTVPAPLSIDTYKPAVAAAALAAGASLINDVGAGREDPAMARLVAESGAGYIAMHMQGTPRDMQEAPRYADVVGEVKGFLARTLARLEAGGVARDQVALDVGIGFGKTVEHNLELLARMADFRELMRPLVLGVSRKSFIGAVTRAGVDDRLAGGLAATCLARTQGAAVVRTHDVAATVQALRMTEAILERCRP